MCLVQLQSLPIKFLFIFNLQILEQLVLLDDLLKQRTHSVSPLGLLAFNQQEFLIELIDVAYDSRDVLVAKELGEHGLRNLGLSGTGAEVAVPGLLSHLQLFLGSVPFDEPLEFCLNGLHPSLKVLEDLVHFLVFTQVEEGQGAKVQESGQDPKEL